MDRRGSPAAAVGAALVRHARRAGVRDPRVLEAVGTVPRAVFVLDQYRTAADVDEPLPIGFGQTTSQPSLIARMVEALGLTGSETVLEVGTGLGYEAALLGRLAKTVYTIEVVPELATEAARRLEEAGASNVHAIHADGSQGYAAAGPFGAIITAAVADRIPPAFNEQLDEGGRLVLPLWTIDDEWAVLYERRAGRLVLKTRLCPVRFVPLVSNPGRRMAHDDEDDAADGETFDV